MSFSLPKVTNKKIKNKYNCVSPSNSIPIIKKRAFLSASFHGVLSAEAAIIVPLIIFMAMFLIFPLFIFDFQLTLHNRLVNCGLKLSEYYYSYNKLSLDESASDSDFIKDMAAKGISISYATEDILNDEIENSINSFFMGKISNISFKCSSVDTDNSIIDLIADYSVDSRLPFNLSGLSFADRCYIRGFSGKSLQSSADDFPILVYIATDRGTAYHRSPYCSYLLHYTTILPPDRNAYFHMVCHNDKFYSACSYCIKMISSIKEIEYLYITPEGEKYHYLLNCPILQHNVVAINLKEGNRGYTPCSRCYN